MNQFINWMLLFADKLDKANLFKQADKIEQLLKEALIFPEEIGTYVNKDEKNIKHRDFDKRKIVDNSTILKNFEPIRIHDIIISPSDALFKKLTSIFINILEVSNPNENGELFKKEIKNIVGFTKRKHDLLKAQGKYLTPEVFRKIVYSIQRQVIALPEEQKKWENLSDEQISDAANSIEAYTVLLIESYDELFTPDKYDSEPKTVSPEEEYNLEPVGLGDYNLEQKQREHLWNLQQENIRYNRKYKK